MIVEDDSPIRAMLADLLEDAGYLVVQAADGLEALRHLREHQPDVIILDLMLPRMSGWQFLNNSREQLDRGRVPVVIVSAIDGRADYPSTLGVAAWFTKPLDVPRFLDAIQQLAYAGGPADSGDARTSGGHLLLVEDDATIRAILTEQLLIEAYSVDAVETIAAARERIRVARPDLIILDLMLPREDGWTFLRQRQTDPELKDIPVLVVSAAPRSRLVEAKELGADGFLSKPFDVDVLNALVQSFVR
jgi:DNA-binding response OmpR family regulator